MEQTNQLKSQFHLFTQRRFLPFFITQFLGAFNDNLFKNALLVIVVSTAAAGSDSSTNFNQLGRWLIYPTLFPVLYDGRPIGRYL